MPKSTVACELFRPGRDLPHNECECGWMRNEHTGRMLPEQISDPNAEIAAWMETAAAAQRNTDFYRSLLIEIGELFGRAAHISDDGSYQADVLIAKVPDLVKELLATKGFASARLPMPQQPPATVPATEIKAFTETTRTRRSKNVYSESDKGDSPVKE